MQIIVPRPPIMDGPSSWPCTKAPPSYGWTDAGQGLQLVLLLGPDMSIVLRWLAVPAGNQFEHIGHIGLSGHAQPRGSALVHVACGTGVPAGCVACTVLDDGVQYTCPNTFTSFWQILPCRYSSTAEECPHQRPGKCIYSSVPQHDHQMIKVIRS